MKFLNLDISTPVLLISLALAACLMGDAMLYAVMPSSPETWGLSTSAIALMLSVNRFIRIASNPMAAVLFRKFGKQSMLVFALFLSVYVTMIYGWSTAFFLLITSRILWGIAFSILRLGTQITVFEETEESNRGFQMGASLGIMRMGNVFGAILGSISVQRFGHRATLTGFTIAIITSSVLWFLKIPERSKQANVKPLPTQNEEHEESVLSQFEIIFRDKQVFLFLIASFLTGLIFPGLMWSTTGFYLLESFGDNITTLGISISVISLTGLMLGMQWSLVMPVAPLVGKASDRYGRITVIVCGLLIGIVGLTILSLSSTIILSLLAIFLAFLAGVILAVVLPTTIGELVGSSKRAAALSVYATCADLGSGIGPIIGLSFGSLLLLKGIFIFSAFLLGSTAIIIVLAFRNVKLFSTN